MRHLLLLLASVCYAEMPAHSVSGPVTYDISEFSVAVPYGPAEVKSTVSVCISHEALSATVNVSTWTDGSVQSVPLKKTQSSGWCGSMIVPFARVDIERIHVEIANTIIFNAPPKTAKQ